MEGQPSETSPLLGQDATISTEQGIEQSRTAAASHGNGTFNAHAETNPSPGQDVEPQAQDANDQAAIHEGQPELRKRLPIIFPAVSIGVFLVAADQTIIVSSYGQIGSELAALNMTSWIATAYFLTLTAFQPLYGKLSDIFGRRACLLWCYSVFALGSAGCGLAGSMAQLVGARALAGVGGGGLNVVVTVLMSDIVPLRERGKWQGFLNLIFATGASAGAPLGGLFADRVGWRWAFLLQVPLCLVAVVAVAFAVRVPSTPGDANKDAVRWTQKVQRVDFVGAAALLVAVFLLLLALDRGSNVSWAAPITYGSLIGSVVVFAVFIAVEMKVAKEPFAPGHVIFSRSLSPCYVCNFFSMAAGISAVFYTSLYLQAVHDRSATAAGLLLIPNAVSSVTGSLSVGYYMQKIGKYYWITIIGYSVLFIGPVVMVMCSGAVLHSMAGVLVGLGVAAFGNSAGVTTTLIALLANTAPEDQAIAIACSYLFRSLGSAFGISMLATVTNQTVKEGLAARLPALGLSQREALEVATRVRRSLKYLRELKPAVRAVVVDCYAQGTTNAFALDIGLAFGAAFVAWFVREKALSR